MTIERALELILGNLGVLILLLVILVGGFRGWWVYGRFYDAQTVRITQLEARLDRASRVAENGTGLAQHAASLVERQIEARDA